MSWARQGEEAGECLKMQKLCLCIALPIKELLGLEREIYPFLLLRSDPWFYFTSWFLFALFLPSLDFITPLNPVTNLFHFSGCGIPPSRPQLKKKSLCFFLFVFLNFWPHFKFFFFFFKFWHVGSNPCALQWKYRVLTTGPPGKSQYGDALNWFVLKRLIWLLWGESTFHGQD